ncbi:MAG: hypothetical protein P1U88_19690 [Thalassobaculaceae bacterium]|nr:hypothetical protein [Thalassobaculaceae bacterium]
MYFTTIPTSGFSDEAVTQAKRLVGVTTITATSHDLTASDADTLLAFDNPDRVTVTVPTDAASQIDIGTTFRLAQIGVGSVSVVGAEGVVIDGYGGTPTAARYAVIDLVKRTADAWLVSPAV